MNDLPDAIVMELRDHTRTLAALCAGAGMVREARQYEERARVLDEVVEDRMWRAHEAQRVQYALPMAV